MRYTVLLLPDPEVGGYVAYVPAIPGCVTQGETIQDAMAMAEDAASVLLEVMAERDEQLPVEAPGGIVGSVDVKVPALAVRSR